MSQTTERMHELVDRLNRYRQEYYNENAPSVSDAVYDHLYDELARLEAETGIILSSSPKIQTSKKSKLLLITSMNTVF